MLIPIIKDFNNAFSYLVSNSLEKTKEVFDPVSKSLLHLSQDQANQPNAINDIFNIGWTGIRICFWFLIQSIQYVVSFQWLRDFSYLPISIPNNRLGSNENNAFIQSFNNSVVSLMGDRQNILQRFLFSNQTIAKPETGLTLSDQNLAYNNFLLGLPNVTHHGAPINSWSLSFLSNKWFDPLTVPVNFLSSCQEAGSQNISQLSSLPEQITSDSRITNIILMSILICITTGFSSFFNSFFIFFPLSLSNLLGLRYLMVQKFWAGCVSVLGIVLGEIVFMLFLVLPPPFIQITLVYLESVWPYIIGLSLIIFIIFDLISNPYTNTMSLSQSNNQISSTTSTPPLKKQTPLFASTNWTRGAIPQFLPIKLGNNTAKIFGFSFLLALTEQSCYFSFFGTLNLSSTGNFLDTYIFAASRSPIILFFSCVGFLVGSFLAITIYNLIIAKIIFLLASLAIQIKQYNPDLIRNWIVKRQTNFKSSMKDSKDSKNDSVSPAKFFIFRIYTSVKNNIISSSSYWFSTIKQKDSLKSLVLGIKNLIQLFISYLPGGKRIIFFLFPGQAHSYKSNFQTTSAISRSPNVDFNSKSEGQLTLFNNQRSNNPSFPIGFQTASTGTRLSIESRVENMLGSDFFNPSSSFLSSISRSSRDSLASNNQISGNASQLGGSAFYNKIDKILLTCLITLSFTTIPYYSFDYLINSFFGFIPQDQILNAHSLRVNFPDYTNLLGITLSDNNSVINTDVSLYDRAHFMYGEWPNSFESLNYQGELMWTNLRDHRRQKRTRRSTRLKFKTLKTKISTSWKEFKRSSGFSGSTRPSSFSDQTKWDSNFSEPSQVNSPFNNQEEYERSKIKHPSKNLSSDSSQKQDFPISSLQIDNKTQAPPDLSAEPFETSQKETRDFWSSPKTTLQAKLWGKTQKYLRNTNNLSNVFYKIFLAAPFKNTSALNENTSRFTNQFGSHSIASPGMKGEAEPRNIDIEPNSSMRKSDFNQNNSQNEYPSKIFESTSPTKNTAQLEPDVSAEPFETSQKETRDFGSSPKTTLQLKRWGATQNKIMPKIPEEIRRSTSLNETIKALSSSTFIDLSGGEKYIKTYPKNWKRVITEKYYQNPIYKTILSNDLKNFLKREPLTQQLTNKQENELYFLRVKMAHYYDSLRFYFTLKEQINSTRSKVDRADVGFRNDNKNKQNVFSEETSKLNALKPFETIWNHKHQSKISSLSKTKSEPIMVGAEDSFKSPPLQFKSMTSMNYRQQFKGTLKTVKQLFAISLPESAPSFSSTQSEQNPAWNKDYDFRYKESNQPVNAFSELTGGTEPIEQSYKYDKYLFNEYSYPKNEFLHEEGPTLTNRKSNPSSNFRESHSQNVALSSSGVKGAVSSNEATGSRAYRGIGLATKNIHNLFGSNHPFYVGWDQNLRKFVLTSRILSRSSTLNYNATNPKLNVDKNQKPKPLNGYSDVPIYSDSAFDSTRNFANGWDTTKDMKNLEEKKPNFNQQSVHIYRPYTSWPFFKHQLKNLPNRPYFVLYENYLNILNKRIHLFRNININDIDTKSLTFLYSYSFNNNIKKYVSQLPINIYKQSMRPSSLENLFTPTSNARTSFLWPGSMMPAWEYYFW